MIMLKKIRIVLFIIVFVSLFSCSKDEWNKDNELWKKIDNEINVNLTWANNKDEWENWDIVYDKENKKLIIWDKVTIMPWLPDWYIKEVKIYNNSITYTNSNVKDYLFFVVDNSKKVSDISKYYNDMFSKLWYIRINEEQDKNINIDIEVNQKLEFVLKNEKYKDITKIDPDDLINQVIENKYLQRVIININDSTPNNIKNSTWLDWRFVEVYYNQINI